MSHEPEKEKEVEIKAGYLVIRLKPGLGVMISDLVEIRLNCIKSMGEAQIAIRAPKEMLIRKIR